MASRQRAAYLRDLVDVARRNLGDESPFTARAVSMLGAALTRLGRTDEAMTVYQGARRTQQLSGVMTPRVAGDRIGMAVALAGANRRAEAERLLVGLERDLRENRPATLDGAYGVTHCNLGCFAALRGARASALDLVGKAVDMGAVPVQQLEQDTDLALVRGPDLDALIARVKAKAARPK